MSVRAIADVVQSARREHAQAVALHQDEIKRAEDLQARLEFSTKRVTGLQVQLAEEKSASVELNDKLSSSARKIAALQADLKSTQASALTVDTGADAVRQ